MKPVIISGIAIIGLFLLSLFFSYGTISPCGMLSKELKSDVLRNLVDQTSMENKWEIAGIGLGAAIVGPMLDSFISSLTPMECARGLVKYKFEDENIFSESLGSASKNFEGEDDNYSTSKVNYEPKDPKWSSYSEISPIDDSTNVFVYIDSNESVSSWVKDDVVPTLVIRCKENKTNVLIDLGLRPMFKYRSYGAKYASLRLRYDEDKVIRQRLSVSTHGKAVFFSNHIPTVKKMLKHKKLLVEFTPFNSSSQIAVFNLSGLNAEIGPLREACHW